MLLNKMTKKITGKRTIWTCILKITLNTKILLESDSIIFLFKKQRKYIIKIICNINFDLKYYIIL